MSSREQQRRTKEQQQQYDIDWCRVNGFDSRPTKTGCDWCDYQMLPYCDCADEEYELDMRRLYADYIHERAYYLCDSD
jgi:hypothetical protein